MMTRQDQGVREPRIRLRRLLALLRILAGRRGHARIRWSGAGFVYQLDIERSEPVELLIDLDPTAENGEQARSLLWETFGP